MIYALTKSTEKAGPVGYWKLDEGDGTVAYDASGNNNNGVLTNFDFNATSGWTTGKVAGALKFDGVNDLVNVTSNNTLNPTDAVSLEMWVYPYNYPQVENRGVYKSGQYNLDLNNGYGRMEVYVDGAYRGANNPNNIASSSWHHLVGTYDSSAREIKFYVDGVLKQTTTLVGLASYTIATSTNDFKIGYSGLPPVYGLIDEVKIYNRALSAAEIQWEYNRGGPVGWWKFDEGSGSTIYDSSGNGNTGTWSGTGSHWAEGKINSAGQFASTTSDYVDCGNSTIFDITNTITLETWIKYDGGGTQYPTIISKQFGSNHIPYHLRIVKSARQFYFSVYKDGIEYGKQWLYTVPLNTWVHVAVTVTVGTSLDLYINGKLYESSAWNVTFPINTTNLYIGRYVNEYFNGLIDDVRIYNYARSAAEIRMDYNSGFAVKFGGSYDLSRGLVGYWDFDEGQGIVAYDGSTNGNNGTLTNFDFNDNSNWTTGKVAGALKFDGTNDYMAMATSVIPLGTKTISLWIKPTFPGAGIQGTLFDDNGLGTGGYGNYIQATENSNVSWTHNKGVGGDSNFIITSNTMSNNSWHYVTFTWDGTTNSGAVKVYIDGILNNTATADTTETNPTSNTLYVGVHRNPSFPQHIYTGLIDDVRIYNRALSADEIRYLYNRKGPVGWWKFDEGTGSSTIAYDSSGNSNNGSIYGASSTAGKINSALSFDGTDDYVSVPDNPAFSASLSQLTLEAWVKRNATGRYDSIAGNFWDGIGRSYYMEVWNTNKIHFYVGTGAGGPGDTKLASTTSTLSNNIWYHISAVYDGANMQIYLNGIADGTPVAQSGTIYNSTQSLFIGSYQNNGSRADLFYGLIDDVRIYNYARTASEIRTDYNEGFATKFGGSYDLTQGLVGYWKFEEGQGTLAKDSSNSGNNGTLTNFDFNSSSGWTMGNIAADTGQALKFDGSNDRVYSGGDFTLTGNDTITLSAWIKTNSSSDQTILSLGGTYMSIAIDNGVFIARNYNAAPVKCSSGYSISTNTWYHLVGVFSGGTVDLYLNGVLVGDNVSCANQAVSGIDMRAGWGYVDSESWFNGIIDDTRVYNRALSADEIRYLYNRKQPIAHWKFDEGTGQYAYDSSINGNTGTFGAGAAAPTWTQGYIGRALSFDGGDYVNCGTGASLNPTLAITLEAWVKRASIGARHNFIGTNCSTPWSFEISEGNTLRADVFVNGGNQRTGWGSTQYTDTNNWHHVAFTYDTQTTNWVIYLDGKIDGSGTFVGASIDGGAQVYIGSEGGCGIYFNGLIDDVRIYNYARTAAETRADYNAGMSTYFK